MEIINAPQRAQNMMMILPGIVWGVMSPYPTVVRVISTTYTELKNKPSISLSDSVIKYFAYLISNILKMYAAKKTVMKNKVRTAYSGLFTNLHLNMNLNPG
jgi:hypothetical protein